MRLLFGGISLAIVGTFLAPSAFAMTDALTTVYESRGDLQLAFSDTTGQAIPGSAAGFLIDIEDWARQYGWQEYEELSAYAPITNPPSPIGVVPETITAQKYIIVDEATGSILAAKDAEDEWPIASITKLMTAQTAIESGVDLAAIGNVKNADNVGGARLWVNDGTTFSMNDLFSAMLIGSANNAATAIARLLGGNAFIQNMNDAAEEMNLGRTRFVDPSGIELGNVSTAREVAYFAMRAFDEDVIRKFTTTAIDYIDVLSTGETKRMKNTNWLLYYPEYEDVYVTGGKTGYLHESKWNLVVRMRPSAHETDKELVIVTLGSDSRAESFEDAKALADWVWEDFDWSSRELSIAAQ